MESTEKAGEAAQAWIGVLGQNPRKGVTHTTEDVVGELADVVFTALVGHGVTWVAGDLWDCASAGSG